MKDYFLIYFLSVTLVSVITTVYDKRAAEKGKKRISEKELFILALLGGALGMYITMLKIRHKTLHKRFMMGLPAVIIAQILIFFLAVDKIFI